MASLLSPQQFLDIRAALQNVTDTFFTSEITYYQFIDNADMLGSQQGAAYNQYDLLGFIEYPDKDTDKTTTHMEGGIEMINPKVSFNYDDLDGLGLIMNNRALMRSETDFMVIQGKSWQVNYVGYDGAFQDNNILVIVDLQPSEKTAPSIVFNGNGLPVPPTLKRTGHG